LSVEKLHERRDLRATADLRGVIKGVLTDLFGVSAAALASEVFPDTGAIAPMRDLVV
jgi:uncharacterized protein (DUF1501 family)